MTRGATLKEAVRSAYIAAHPDERFNNVNLAKRASVSDYTLRRLWNGDIPSLSTLIALANASGASIIDLLTAMQDPPAGQAEDRRSGERRQAEQQAAASVVADAIRDQTAMLERVLGRIMPEPEAVAALPPEVEEAVDEFERQGRTSPQGSGRSVDGER